MKNVLIFRSDAGVYLIACIICVQKKMINVI